MKRFITTVLSVAVLFIGLGAMIANVGARFKSDEKALEIIRAARVAIGGEAALREVKSLVIVGRATNTFKINGVDKSETGETEIALQLPDKMQKSVRIGDGNAIGEDREIFITGKSDGEHVMFEGKDGEFTTSDGKKIVIKKGDNAEFTSEDGKKVIVRSTEKSATATASGDAKVFVRKQSDGGTWKSEGGDNHVFVRKNGDGGKGMKQNELLRTTLGLLLTAPDGMDVEYNYVGEGDVDGTAVNIVNASFGGASYKLFIGRGNNLPVAMSYTGHRMPMIVHFNKETPAPKNVDKDVMIFRQHHDMAGKSSEVTVKFSDFRSTGGVQLPYKWTTVSDGQTTEVFDVTSYDLNPANIADRFKGQKVMMRMAKPSNK
ncbi:MAG: hypothetical protein ACRD6X_09645 [Pyrinomonadaceae bacterium]